MRVIEELDLVEPCNLRQSRARNKGSTIAIAWNDDKQGNDLCDTWVCLAMNQVEDVGKLAICYTRFDHLMRWHQPNTSPVH